MRRPLRPRQPNPPLDFSAEALGVDLVLTSPPYTPSFSVRPRTRLNPAHQYALDLKGRLADALGGELETATEWRCFMPEETRVWMKPYVPRLDLVAGPYAGNYDGLLEQHRWLVEHMISSHQANAEAAGSIFPAPDFDWLAGANSNPRCFIAVEIERALEDPKHLFASASYTAMLGKVGVVIAWTDRRLHRLLQIRETMALADVYRKNALCPANLLILSREQMDAAMILKN